MKVLVYCGVNHGHGFTSLINSGNWSKIYGFEANPYLCENLKKKYSSDTRVSIHNVVLSDKHDAETDFYIIDPNKSGMDYSSGVTNTEDFNPDYEKISGNKMNLKEVVRLKTINLYTFLCKEGITEVDQLLTDLEGSDLTVLKTLKPLIDSRKIKRIQCEVEPDHMPVKYKGLDNKLRGFQNILQENYGLVWKDNVPDHYFHVDCRWELKDV
jgi:FkbM family methyltransferase